MKQDWRVALASLALLGSAGCASPAEQEATAQADACINPTRIQKQEVLSDQEIQFTMANGEVWLNRLPRACPGLKFEQGFSWDVRGMQVCSNEQIITVLNAGNTCQLGVFTRVATGT